PIVALTLPMASATDNDPTTASPAARVHQGLPATVQIDGGDGTVLNASVASVSVAPDGGRRIGQVEVKWNGASPASGGTALVRIVVQHKDDALVIPASSIQTVGSAKYVDSLNGQNHKTIPVQ